MRKAFRNAVFIFGLIMVFDFVFTGCSQPPKCELEPEGIETIETETIEIENTWESLEMVTIEDTWDSTEIKTF
jgi:hypothetical protein